ncbi:MAG TPA: glycosyltransferase [Hanamia sp.]|nr:glycosyltransferase [Hanamia sp.]
MHQIGVKIHLHCFEYGRGRQEELNQYCEEVLYYQRENLTAGIPLRLPYIVSSRINPQLIKNILKDNYPVLLEGIHCTWYLYHGDLSNRKVCVRLHNVEYQYYHRLAKSTNNFYKKIYYNLESRLLKKYEAIIARKANFLALNENDKFIYQKIFSAKNIEFLPAFLPATEVKSLTGKGSYCLYHGNLSVPENEKAVLWLLKNVFSELDLPFIIAGKNSSASLINETSKNKNVQLINNPAADKMEELIKNAQIHLLPSFNTTGIKIKLLIALFSGRFIVANAATIKGTGLESLCCKAETSSDYITAIKELFEIPFAESEIAKRKAILNNLYDNDKNAHQLMKWL